MKWVSRWPITAEEKPALLIMKTPVSFRPSGFDRSAESPYCVEFNTRNALSIEQYNDKPFRLHKPLFN